MEYLSTNTRLPNAELEAQTVCTGRQTFSRYVSEMDGLLLAPDGARTVADLNLPSISQHLFPDGLPADCKMEVLAAAVSRSASFDLLIRLSDSRGRSFYPAAAGQVINLGVLGRINREDFAGMIVSVSQASSRNQSCLSDGNDEKPFELAYGDFTGGETYDRGTERTELRQDIFASPLLSRDILLAELKKFREGDFGGIIGSHISYYLGVVRNLCPRFEKVSVATSPDEIFLDDDTGRFKIREGKIPNQVSICYRLQDSERTNYIVSASIQVGPNLCGTHTFSIGYAAPLGQRVNDPVKYVGVQSESLDTDLRERWRSEERELITDDPNNPWLRRKLRTCMSDSVHVSDLSTHYAFASKLPNRRMTQQPVMEAVAAFREGNGKYVISDGVGGVKRLNGEAAVIFAAPFHSQNPSSAADPNIIGISMPYRTFEGQVLMLEGPNAAQSVFYPRIKSVIEADLRKRNRDHTGLFIKRTLTSLLFNRQHTQIRPGEWIGEDVAVLLCSHTAGAHEIYIKRQHQGGVISFSSGITAPSFFAPEREELSFRDLTMPKWDELTLPVPDGQRKRVAQGA